jgi:hypothetical protein
MMDPAVARKVGYFLFPRKNRNLITFMSRECRVQTRSLKSLTAGKFWR